MSFQKTKNRTKNYSLCLIISVSMCILLFSRCVESDTVKKEATNEQQSDLHADSVEVVNLVKKMYQWYETKSSKGDFMAADPAGGDSQYTEIDRNELSKRLKEMEQSQLFTKAFTDNYNKIALQIDKDLKDKKTIWLTGDMSPYSSGADAWCDCQDSPDQYWETMKITITQLNNSDALLKWSWPDKEDYSIKAKKENGVWKISWLQGFDFDVYTKMMSEGTP